MEILFTILLLVGMCDSPEDDLFCDGENCALVDGSGGAGGAGGGAGGDGGEAGHGGEDATTAASGAGGGFKPCGACDDGNPCNGTEICWDGECILGEGPKALDDMNKCTRNLCRDGLPHYEPVEVDDGDPCTEDLCHPVFGVEHNPIEGCQ